MSNRIRRGFLANCVAAIVALSGASTCLAQLAPEHMFNGVNRPIPVRVDRPEGKQGEMQIQLLAPVSAEVLAQAPVKEGTANLASLFPSLWKDRPAKLMYAQLAIGGERVGSAVVLQPMDGPKVAQANPATGQIAWGSQGRALTGFRAWVDRDVLLDTTQGKIRIAMRPDVAPNTAMNFMQLAAGGYYTDVIFHRIVAKRPDGAPFVIQVGDPSGTGQGGPGYSIDLEPSSLPHDFGIVSMARTNDPNSGGSQIFICLSREGTAILDGQYTSFAQVVEGQDVVRAIAAAPVGPQDRPVDPAPAIKSASLIDAPPYQGVRVKNDAGASTAPTATPSAPVR